MGRKQKEDLQEFKQWLIEYKSLAPKSATVYCSRVRKVIKAVPTVDVLNVDVFAQDHHHESSFTGVCVSWNCFVRFCETKNIVIPKLTSSKASITRASINAKPPEEVIEAIDKLTTGARITVPKLLRITWSRVERADRHWYIKDPEDESLWYTTEQAVIEPLMMWAFEFEERNPKAALIPVRPHALSPISKTFLLSLLREFRSKRNSKR